jgi:hypothetical protein
MTNAAAFARMPSRWIQDGMLQYFTYREADSLHALLTYLCVVKKAAAFQNKNALQLGQAVLTYDEIQSMAHLTRTQVRDAKARLECEGLVKTELHNKATLYTLAAYPQSKTAGHWAKLPTPRLFDAVTDHLLFAHDKRFRQDECATMDAVKLYLLLLAFRPNDRDTCWLSYQNMYRHSGVQLNRMWPALSLLEQAGLMRVVSASRKSGSAPVRAYRLAGVDVPALQRALT